MAFSPSPSPSPGFESETHLSDSSLDEQLVSADTAAAAAFVSRAAYPDAQPAVITTPIRQVETIECQWEECGKVFDHLPTLINHIHNDHIGVHKSNYTCEWKTCSRRGIAQTSRFALISHIRSHTGEKPFICPKPECDKSFTRSDALAKHMRIQHNILPPLPGRGGNRKRKREDTSDTVHPQPVADGYSTAMFKVDQQLPFKPYGGELDEVGRISPMEPGVARRLDYHHNGFVRRRSHSPIVVFDEDEDDDQIPSHLAVMQDPVTGLIMGKSPAMIKYILWKAKYQYVLGEHESLIEELRTLRYEESCWRERKDALLDEVLKVTFGAHAEELNIPHTLMDQVAALGTARTHRQEGSAAEIPREERAIQ